MKQTENLTTDDENELWGKWVLIIVGNPWSVSDPLTCDTTKTLQTAPCFFFHPARWKRLIAQTFYLDRYENCFHIERPRIVFSD